MLSAVDSFIEYLNAQLANNPPVHWVRLSARDESAGIFQHNALNVTLLGITQQGSLQYGLISLDLVGDDSRQVYKWADAILQVLDIQITPELIYEPDPNNPTSNNRLVSWNIDDVDWDDIADRPWRKNEAAGTEGAFVHLNATFPLMRSRK